MTREARQTFGAPESSTAPPGVYEDAYVFPLSFPQERLWYVEQLAPGLATYAVPLAVQLSGALDRRALAAALAGVVSRHESLRTRFRTEAGRPVQVVLPPEDPRASVPLPLVDLSALRAPEDEALLLARAQAARPFDLRRGPLVRATLLRLTDAEHVLLLALHHIVSDRWSMGVLFGELAALYSGQSLPPLAIQYPDYAVWQRERLQGAALERQLAYWRERLRDLPALDLPIDLRRPARPAHRGGQVPVELPADLVAGLRRLSHEAGATLFMTLLAGFLAVLARHAGEEDVAVGTAVANRGRRELEGLVGFFVNTLVLRASLAGEPSFRQLLARVRESALGAYAHQELPFERLVEELRPARDAARPPLVQVAFMLQNTPLPTVSLPGLAVAELPFETGTAKFDLSVSLTELGEGVVGSWEYDAELFLPATVERLAAHHRRLLAAAVESPDAPVLGLPMTGDMAGDGEMEALLAGFARPLG
jgi:hypothetical protein